MKFWLADLPDLVIPSTNNSNAISLFEDAYGVSVQAPPTLTACQVTVQVAVSSGAAATFSTLQSGGADVLLFAGKALIMTPLPYRQFRINSTTAEGASRTFQAAKVFPV